MLQAQALSARIEAVLKTLPVREAGRSANAGSRASMDSLYRHCERLSSKAAVGARPRIRTIHHLACTGGTVVSKCLAAQPNTVLLSEVDPLSAIHLKNVSFAPSDILKLAQTGLRPLADIGVEKTFLAGLRAMHDYLLRRGRRLVLRDHAHSHFCTNVDPVSRPALRDILSMEFETLAIVTVRHPLDAYLSLKRNNWVMFSPGTFEEYCRRNLMFLNHHDDLPVIRYEDFVLEPDNVARRVAGLLELSYSADWRELLPIITVTGDSGRRGTTIRPRPRLAVPSRLAQEVEDSPAYNDVCARLGYPTEIHVSPYERA